MSGRSIRYAFFISERWPHQQGETIRWHDDPSCSQGALIALDQGAVFGSALDRQRRASPRRRNRLAACEHAPTVFHYRLMQVLYRELVEESFAGMAHEFAFYNALPVRWRIRGAGWDAGGEPALYMTWMPVPPWNQTVRMSSSVMPPCLSGPKPGLLRAELQRLNRLGKRREHSEVDGVCSMPFAT